MDKVKDKIKQLKYQYLKKIFEKYLSKTSENCKYNKEIYLSKQRLQVCTFDLDNVKELDMCYKREHSEYCNAFCYKYSKETLKETFIKELADPQIRATKYKDINVLYWEYPELEKEEFPEMPKSLWEKILNFLKFWQ
jgi:hypothetical protein